MTTKWIVFRAWAQARSVAQDVHTKQQHTLGRPSCHAPMPGHSPQKKTEIWTLVSPKYLNLFPQPSMSQRPGARASPHPARTPTPSMRMLWITSWGHARYGSRHSKTQHLTPKKKARQKGQSYKGMLGHQRREADGMRASWGCPCGPRWPTWKDTSEAHTYKAWAGLWRPVSLVKSGLLCDLPRPH